MSKRIELYKLGYDFLVDKIGQESLDRELDYYTNIQVNSLNDTYKQLLISMQNRQGFTRFLAPVDDMNDILFDFDSNKVLNVYENNHALLFDKLKQRFAKKSLTLITNEVPGISIRKASFPELVL